MTSDMMKSDMSSDPRSVPVLRTRTTPAGAVRDALVIGRRNLLRNVRLPQLLVFATVQPVMFLVLFAYVFGGAIEGTLPAAAGGEYLNWLVPGLMIQVAAFGSGQTALGLTEDLQNGVIDRFRSLPMARSAVLAGRTGADLVRNAVVIGLMVSVGAALGFRYQTTFVRFLAGFGLALLFAHSLSWVMAALGLKVRTPEAVQSAAFLPIFPLVFASSVFLPTQTMPDWLRVFADNQPLTVVTNAMRGLMLGDGALPPGQELGVEIVRALVWIAAITAVAATVAVRSYRRITS
jgi:ABC transporter DrrB family efflux protein